MARPPSVCACEDVCPFCSPVVLDIGELRDLCVSQVLPPGQTRGEVIIKKHPHNAQMVPCLAPYVESSWEPRRCLVNHPPTWIWGPGSKCPDAAVFIPGLLSEKMH